MTTKEILQKLGCYDEEPHFLCSALWDVASSLVDLEIIEKATKGNVNGKIIVDRFIDLVIENSRRTLRCKKIDVVKKTALADLLK